jgi:hypothetical protein
MIADLLAWWYGPGLKDVWQRAGKQSKDTLDAFSVGLLARTLFSPFRQIDAGTVRGSIDVQFRAFIDRNFSRVFGFFIRSFMIIIGFTFAAIMAIAGFVWAIVWILVPIAPIVGLVLWLLEFGV